MQVQAAQTPKQTPPKQLTQEVKLVRNKKKRMSNCHTLLKRVFCMQYSLPHLHLKVTMTFEWSCGVLLCQNSFLSPLCVCVFVSQKSMTNNIRRKKVNSFISNEKLSTTKQKMNILDNKIKQNHKQDKTYYIHYFAHMSVHLVISN